MITQAAQVKCFPLSQKQLLISGPCLQTLAHISYFLPPCLCCLSLTRCSQRGWCSPQCAACSMVDVTEPATRRDLRERRIEGFVAATIKSFIAGMTRLPHPTPPHPTLLKPDHWMIHGVKCEGVEWVGWWLHHCCVWAFLVLLTLTCKRDVMEEGGGSVCTWDK